MGRCLLINCMAIVDDEDLLDHLRVVHPDVYGDGPEYWPDGELVVHDTTLDPADFDPEGGDPGAD